MLRLGALLTAVGLIGLAAAWVSGAGIRTLPTDVTIDLRYSRFEPASVSVPAGVPITIVLRNGDPIDHEWIVGDVAVHDRHRTGTEPAHGTRPTEVTVQAGETRITTIVFETPGVLRFVCHLPGHEEYGMTGEIVVGG